MNLATRLYRIIRAEFWFQYYRIWPDRDPLTEEERKLEAIEEKKRVKKAIKEAKPGSVVPVRQDTVRKYYLDPLRILTWPKSSPMVRFFNELAKGAGYKDEDYKLCHFEVVENPNCNDNWSRFMELRCTGPLGIHKMRVTHQELLHRPESHGYFMT